MSERSTASQTFDSLPIDDGLSPLERLDVSLTKEIEELNLEIERLDSGIGAVLLIKRRNAKQEELRRMRNLYWG